MAKSSGNLSSKRSLSHNTKPYDANNSFVKKVATRVTDFIPQPSWISKWFNTSQGNGDISNDSESFEEAELEEDIEKPPPSKRPRIRTDITHPPGTFSVRPKVKTSNDKTKISKEKYSMQDDTRDDFLKPTTAGPSGIGHLICSTPTTQLDSRPVATQRSDLNLLIPTSNNGTANGMDDNSESSESTSGCSSLIPQTNRQEASSHDVYNSSYVGRKRFIDEKLTFTNHLQSPRALFVESNSRDTLSSRRPSFNASVMTNTLDRASSMSSPFYNGNTTFGGANTVGLYKRSQSKSLLNTTSDIKLKVPRKTSVQVKPLNTAVDPSGMSQTARKILEALEHFSSPISDAKKIPLKSTNNTASLVNKKRQREENETPSPRVGLRHLTRELTVPTVPDMLKLRRCQKLQDTTVAARKIVSARNGPPPPSQDYCLGSDESGNVKFPGKVKVSAKTNLSEEGTIKTVNLPSVPLPISSLPNFNFTLPQTSKNLSSKEENFKFASPIKVTDPTQNLKSINNFTFSNPINAEDHQILNKPSDSWLLSKPLNSELNSLSNTSSMPTSNFIWSGSSTAPRPKEKRKHETNSQIGVKATSDFKATSVIDVLCNKPSEKTSSLPKAEPSLNASTKKRAYDESSTISPDKGVNGSTVKKSEDLSNNTEQTASEIWECSECLIRNNSSTMQCCACKALKPKSNVQVTVSLPTSSNVVKTKTTATDCFGSKFKVSSIQWSCTSCSTKNKQTDTKCISCNTQKTENLTQTGTSLTAISKSDNIMSKFRPTGGSWECPGCMLRNSATTITCPCCSASKPSSLKVSPKKNKTMTAQESVSNQEVNLNTNVNTTISNNSQLPNSAIMEKFKPTKDSWECPSCMVRNADSAAVCPCCNTAKPNAKGNQSNEVQKLPAPNGFGDKFKKPEGSWSCDCCMVQNKAESLECVSCSSAKPGSAKPKESTLNTGSSLKFNFGIPAAANNFKFGIDKADGQSKSGDSSINNFKFGSIQQSNETGKFVFGIPKEDKSDISKSVLNISAPIVTPKTSECNTGFQFNTKSEKAATNTNSTESEKKALPFSFGIPKCENSILSTEKKLDSTVQSPFSFGINKTEVNTAEKKEDQKTASENIASVIKSTTNVTDSSFTPKVNDNTSIAVTTTQNNILESTSKPTFSFTASNTATPVSNSTSIAPSTCLPSYSQHSFTFSDAKTATQTTTTPTFGQIVTSSSNATSTVPAIFSFGTSESVGVSDPPAKKINTSIDSAGGATSQIFTNVSKTMPLFSNSDAKTTAAFGTGETNVSAFTTGENKPPLFGTSETKVPVFGNTENKSSIFGTTETKMSLFGNTEKSTPVFGNTEKNIPVFGNTEKNTPVFSTPSATPTPTFGSRTNNAVLFGPSAPVFGNNTTTNFGSGSAPNIFSTTKPSENNTSNPSLFTFGVASNQTAPQSGNGFNFSVNNNSAGSAQKPLFTFGSNSNTQQCNNLFGGSGFNNTAQTNTPNFTFNAPKSETSTFGQPAAATPLFGTLQNNQNQSTSSFSSTPSSNAGYNFGNTTPATTSGGFNFDRVEPTSTPSGGFNFNPPSSTPTVSFDPNTPPSFHFTGGSAPTSFKAPPPAGPRKIKKAVRRMRHAGSDSQR
ncbi:hypothetical protein KPH14_008877 [Odynerus spinipes]|uniref:Nuclear pore complex protein Nup153 n=1 Tax=Odynerus spinipes TaxID=1348599 RepID=A0AAD9RFE2_9HYME|nr:hypothetical protein KPH14_008877 [Odynerus spinipes]